MEKKFVELKYNSLSCFLQLATYSPGETSSNDDIFYDRNVLKLYYDILRKVEKDPFKYWNISSLRNYLWAFYMLSYFMSNNIITIPQLHLKSNHIPALLNIYEGSDFALFFTGLYSKYKNKGCRDGLFIVCNKNGDSINREVIPYSEVLAKYEECLTKITIKSTFEEYYHLSHDGTPKTINEIEELPIFDYKNYDKNEDKPYKDKTLHILIDGVDNIPIDYFKFLYEIEPKAYLSRDVRKSLVSESLENNKETFKKYQDIMIKAISLAIKNAKNDNKFNQLPLNLYIKSSDNPFQYFLPIDFTGTGNPDFCACISVDDDGTGKLRTILNMNEVYGNVRVFGKEAVESVKDWWV